MAVTVIKYLNGYYGLEGIVTVVCEKSLISQSRLRSLAVYVVYNFALFYKCIFH